jgi:hypothetical protein
VIDDHNRGEIGDGVTAPWNVPPAGSGGLSSLGQGLASAIIGQARAFGAPLPAELDDPDPPPRLLVDVLRRIAGHFFPLLADRGADPADVPVDRPARIDRG